MSAVYGKVDTYSNSTLGNLRISMEDLVGKYPAKSFPLINRLNGDIFERAVDARKYEWKEENLRPTEDTLNGAIATTGATSIVVDTAGVFNIDDVIQVGSEIMVVTAVASDGVTLTVIRGWAGTTAATASDGATVYRIGIAAPEGKDADGAVMQPLSDLYNLTQIFEDVVEMSGTEEEAFIYRTNEGGSNSNNQITKKQQELMEMYQQAILFGRRGEDITGKRRTMGGLKWFIDTYAPNNVVNMGGASAWTTQSTLVPSVTTTPYTVAQEKIDDLISTIAAERGKPTAMYVGYTALRRMGLFELGKVETDRKDTARGRTAVKTYLSQVGPIDVVMIPGNSMKNNIFIVDEDRVGVKPFKNRGWFTEKLAKNGDSNKWQILGEYTMKMSTPKIAGYVYNLGL